MKRNNFISMFDEITNSLYGLNRNMEVNREKEGYAVSVLLPGFLKEEISVEAEGCQVEITAKTERDLPSFLSTSFSQVFHLDDLDVDSVQCKLENGVLQISLSTKKKKDSRKIVLS
jgi:HSP20 family protein